MTFTVGWLTLPKAFGGSVTCCGSVNCGAGPQSHWNVNMSSPMSSSTLCCFIQGFPSIRLCCPRSAINIGQALCSWLSIRKYGYMACVIGDAALPSNPRSGFGLISSTGAIPSALHIRCAAPWLTNAYPVAPVSTRAVVFHSRLPIEHLTTKGSSENKSPGNVDSEM